MDWTVMSSCCLIIQLRVCFTGTVVDRLKPREDVCVPCETHVIYIRDTKLARMIAYVYDTRPDARYIFMRVAYIRETQKNVSGAPIANTKEDWERKRKDLLMENCVPPIKDDTCKNVNRFIQRYSVASKYI